MTRHGRVLPRWPHEEGRGWIKGSSACFFLGAAIMLVGFLLPKHGNWIPSAVGVFVGYAGQLFCNHRAQQAVRAAGARSTGDTTAH